MKFIIKSLTDIYAYIKILTVGKQFSYSWDQRRISLFKQTSKSLFLLYQSHETNKKISCNRSLPNISRTISILN